MNTKNTPAFPVYEQPREEMSLNCYSEGMTLRDYFAAKVLQGLCAANEVDKWNAAAGQAYNAADAMLEARLK